jgi:hypothetical protein
MHIEPHKSFTGCGNLLCCCNIAFLSIVYSHSAHIENKFSFLWLLCIHEICQVNEIVYFGRKNLKLGNCIY